MTAAEINFLATELVHVALNPDRLRAVLRVADADDPGCLSAIADAIKETGATRNM